MRAGETDKSVSFKDEKLFSLIEKFVKDSGYKGQISARILMLNVMLLNAEYLIMTVSPQKNKQKSF